MSDLTGVRGFCGGSSADEELVHVAIVTAHPDDEVLFFAPTIQALQRDSNVCVHVICLSSGRVV